MSSKIKKNEISFFLNCILAFLFFLLLSCFFNNKVYSYVKIKAYEDHEETHKKETKEPEIKKEFLIYDLNDAEAKFLKELYPLEVVFSSTEKKLLKKSGVNTNVFKLSITEKELLQLKKALTEFSPNTLSRIEINPKQKLFVNNNSYHPRNEYQTYQWALNNEGDVFERWISDIDLELIFAKTGEDINSKKISERDKKIRIAIIDSGIDIEHPDLKNKILRNDGECKALKAFNQCLKKQGRSKCLKEFKTIDTNKNGYPLDCSGWNLGDKQINSEIQGGPIVNDRNGHGTHVAGIIAAEDNNIGIKGVIQNAQIIPIQVGVSSSSYSEDVVATDVIAKAVLYAIENKAQVINLSLGWRSNQDSTLMRQMVDYALKEGIIIVAAAGNDAHSESVFPCSYNGVICVASHDMTGKISKFSNRGFHIDLLAPGEKILSTWPTSLRSKRFTLDNNYEYMSGTSQAAPFVTGAVALLLNQGVSQKKIITQVFSGARKKLEKLDIKFGNLDVKNSNSASYKEMIIPSLKTSALVNWQRSVDNTYSFLLKLKNIGKKSSKQTVTISSTNSLIRVDNSSVGLPTLKSDEEIQERIFFTSPHDIDSRLKFKLSTEKNDFVVQTKAINLVGPSDKNALSISTSVDLRGMNTRSFENFYTKEEREFLIYKKSKNRIIAYRMRENDNKVYELSSPITFNKNTLIILKLSKVDLNLDGDPEYVITTIEGSDSKNKNTRFTVLDKFFRPSTLQVTNENLYSNEYSVLTARFYWVKKGERKVPMWVDIGKKDPSTIRQTSPWQRAQTINSRSSHLYYLSERGLETIDLDNNYRPIQILFQSEANKYLGKIHFISADSFNFYKKYQIHSFIDKPVHVQKFELRPYIDLLKSLPRRVSNSLYSDNAYFTTQSNDGGLRLVDFSENSIGTFDINYKYLKSKESPLLRVLNYNGQDYIAQTRFKLVNARSSVESMVDTSRVKHKSSITKMALFLPSKNGQSFGNEFITQNVSGELYYPADSTFFPTASCFESEYISDEAGDEVVFICSEEKKIIRINI